MKIYFHSHDTRSKDNLHLTHCKTAYGSKSLRYKGGKEPTSK